MAVQRDSAIRANIGKRLTVARRLAKKTQSDVMRDVFESKNLNQRNRISSIETGKVAPDAELLQKLCSYYAVSCDWVLGFTHEPEIDRDLSRIGILYTSLFQSILPSVESVVQELSIVGARHMSELPKECFIELLDTAKLCIFHCQKENIWFDSLPTLMNKVREVDVKLSKSEMATIKYIDDFSDGLNTRLESRQLADICKSNHASSKVSIVNQMIAHVQDGQLQLFEDVVSK